MCGIVKHFGTVVANAGVDFDLQTGEVHALLGENGAGKTTLMKILYGLYQPDEGTICVGGQRVSFRSPADALAHGIGMVTQHFALAPRLTVSENVVLGREPGALLRADEARRRVRDLAARYGFSVDADAPVRELSVGEQQRVEILKALHRECRTLILDEPTAVLTPQESRTLFAHLRGLVDQGLSVVFISHKLEEVLSVSDRVTVLRDGRVVGRTRASETSPEALARMMVGREIFSLVYAGQGPAAPGEPVLELEDIEAADDRGLPAVRGVSLHVRAGEILALAGVAGNGQSELVEVVCGLRRPRGGRVRVGGKDVTGANAAEMTAAGVGRIPEDRLQGVVPDLTVAENIALETMGTFTGRGGVILRARMTAYARELIEQYQIKATPTSLARTLSGGNLQKLILARVLVRCPRVIVAAQPTRGLDVGATTFVHEQLLAQKAEGTAILLVSEDLDEVLALADTIAVMYSGKIVGAIPRGEADAERLGLLMAGSQGRASNTHGQEV
ncbi:MAG TPA: ABC transporter ATP-binding protein [Firmicutes bacterium]|nr:ABC transporter ATP-binding protein [Bacillota bacterium]